MDIKISKEGWLSIYRDGKWKQQYCPYDSQGSTYCGDQCPLFSLSKTGDKTLLGTQPDFLVDLHLCRAHYSINLIKEA